MKMIADKSFKYGTRHLEAGDEFEAQNRSHAAILAFRKRAHLVEPRTPGKIEAPPAKLKKRVAKATGKGKGGTAKAAEPEPEKQPEPAEAAAPEPTAPPAETEASDDLTTLRHQYKDKFGKQPFMGWDAAALKDKLDAK